MFGGPVQLAYAVDDIDRSTSAWTARGVGPFFVREHVELADVRVRGRLSSFDHSSAFAQWGDVMVELIHQHGGDGDPIVGVSGLHHMAHFVDDFETASAHLAAIGLAEVLSAETTTGTRFAFHDALDDRGHLIEIYERTPALAQFYDMVRAAAVDWNGAEPVRRL